MRERKKGNHLVNEQSPYLLQHVYNPVDWYPWSEEAFEKAKIEDKPVFLSIGYSTCHWCHVMEKESFEDEDIAGLMNDKLVSIKVDREERPDIDSIYMNVCQMMTGRGGWPLSVFLTPEKKPFFAATYIPKESRPGRTGFGEIIDRIYEVWKYDRSKIDKTTETLMNHLNAESEDKSAGNKDFAGDAYNYFEMNFDRSRGGFGNAPKFPSPHNLMLLLRYRNNTGEDDALKMVEKTLTEMRKGGMYDQVGYGFHRYSTDANWLVPHFEKMLYDQAMLAIIYSEAYTVTGNQLFRKTAEEIVEYVIRDMTSPEGAFYSAEDADSEGVEGLFYIWSYEELKNILKTEELNFIADNFGVKLEGNFFEEVSGFPTQKNIIHYTGDNLEDLSSEIWDGVRKKLFAERKKRIHPLKDDKILTDWNGMMIFALMQVYSSTGNRDYLEYAIKAAEFILREMFNEETGLKHRFRGGESHITGKLDDYAWITLAFLELFQTTADTKYLKHALKLADMLHGKFFDKENGGFFLTSVHDEQLIIRPKDFYDGAYPSGNSVAYNAFLRLYALSTEHKYLDIAESVFMAAVKRIGNIPGGFTYLLCGEDFRKGNSFEIIITGKSKEELEDTADFLRSFYLPSKVVIIKNPENSAELETLLPYLKNYKVEDKTKTYICREFRCSLPAESKDEIKKLLS